MGEKAESDVEGGEKEGEDKSAQDAEDEEDPSNLQLAWEMLELAKVVYSKTVETEKDNKEAGHRLCETYMVLGEVSLENENYPQAVEDLQLCLDRRVSSLPLDSRCIAETHYQLGIAQGFDMSGRRLWSAWKPPSRCWRPGWPISSPPPSRRTSPRRKTPLTRGRKKWRSARLSFLRSGRRSRTLMR